MALNLRILLIFVFVVISETAAGFVQDNQNIFYGHSDGFKSAPISYQSFVNYDTFPTSDHNSFDGHSSKLNARSTLFKEADYAAQTAYEEEVENAHRVALANRRNDTDAAYAEAYTEAIKAQRKADGSVGTTKTSYILYQPQNQFGLKPEQSHSRLPAESKSNFQGSRYEDGDNVEYELRKSVEYIVDPNYKFNVNRVVRQQSQNMAASSDTQF